ncbi:hypothetical protein ACFWWA_20410 [Streptomyces goshikiensis]|uniref:hypothetical protein n=1 Tax=Streptomyces goshikiensis TaxID=1942 RepID=UPI00365A679C
MIRTRARRRLQQRRGRRAAAREAVQGLDTAVARLGFTTGGLPHTRAGLVLWHSLPHIRPIQAVLTLGFGMAISGCIAVLLFPYEIDALRHVTSYEFAAHAHSFVDSQQALNDWEGVPRGPLLTAVLLWFGTAYGIWSALVALLSEPIIRNRAPDMPYTLIGRSAHALTLCADVYDTVHTDRLQALHELDRHAHKLEERILKVYRESRVIPRRSPRRAVARQHGRHVAAALRQQLMKVDVDPRQGTLDYAAMAAEISENYAQGKVAGLLPEAKLADVPLPSPFLAAFRESLHIAGAILAAILAAIATAALLPKLGFITEDLHLWLIAGAAAVVGILTAGWHRFARLIPLFGP